MRRIILRDIDSMESQLRTFDKETNIKRIAFRERNKRKVIDDISKTYSSEQLKYAKRVENIKSGGSFVTASGILSAPVVAISYNWLRVNDYMQTLHGYFDSIFSDEFSRTLTFGTVYAIPIALSAIFMKLGYSSAKHASTLKEAYNISRHADYIKSESERQPTII